MIPPPSHASAGPWHSHRNYDAPEASAEILVPMPAIWSVRRNSSASYGSINMPQPVLRFYDTMALCCFRRQQGASTAAKMPPAAPWDIRLTYDASAGSRVRPPALRCLCRCCAASRRPPSADLRRGDDIFFLGATSRANMAHLKIPPSASIVVHPRMLWSFPRG